VRNCENVFIIKTLSSALFAKGLSSVAAKIITSGELMPLQSLSAAFLRKYPVCRGDLVQFYVPRVPSASRCRDLYPVHPSQYEIDAHSNALRDAVGIGPGFIPHYGLIIKTASNLHEYLTNNPWKFYIFGGWSFS
jgi:hypothetical protein